MALLIINITEAVLSLYRSYTVFYSRFYSLICDIQHLSHMDIFPELNECMHALMSVCMYV